MTKTLPEQSQIVIIGGGVIGCSVAYHLTKRGCKDVVLLERSQLTCGTTWHAAGLIGQMRATNNMTQLAKYTAELYAGLEEETGQATGFQQTGSMFVTANTDRLEEIKRTASMATVFGIESHMISPSEIKDLWPLLATEDLIGGLFLPTDGKANPVDITLALARGARSRGANIIEGVGVTDILKEGGRVTGVVTDQGRINAEIVINCGGMWGHQLGRKAGVNVPLHAAEHFYIVTDPMEGLAANAPVVRDPDAYAYYKEDAGKLLLGCFEPIAKPWGMDGIPERFSFDQLPDDWDHFEPVLELALKRLPALETAGIQLFFNGPESFTPDDRYLLGEAPELKNFFVAAGFNSVGIQSAGGAGRVLADWVLDGYPPMDLWDVDIRRMMPFQTNRKYLRDRTVESLGLLYAMHWPFRQVESARGVRKSPLHSSLNDAGACFGELAGWERPNWYAPEGVEAKYEYSYGRQNWFEHSAAEHKAVREKVGLFDQTSFAKFELQGRDATRVLNQICANDIDVDISRVVYTQWLNHHGGIEADLTVTRLATDHYLIVTSGTSQVRDFSWLKRNIPEDAHAIATDMTSAYAVLGIMGPNSRALLASLTPDDMSNEAFPFGTSAVIDLGYARVRASRITYVGELGWELYIPMEFVQDVYDVIVEEGKNHGLMHAGYHALNSLRMEKAYRHWGHDITDEDSPLESGLGFAVKMDKPGGFIGRDALLAQKEKGLNRRLVLLKLDDSDPLLYHNEPVYRNGMMVGHITSAMYGHTLKASLGFAYVDCPDGDTTAACILSADYEIEIAGERFSASPSLQPLYDPKMLKVKS
ncbi:FAD-dependent oxidoreductase [Sneathiella marina]|uniref:FAD-dependent oxidoreductase n=1 Tax=Sneathiella marina TaxID=2950108 RepID=A0ABY4W5Y0_9PROT|nr:FAD-dependent oxidoreductase [Sneathiella marina]USG62601.1 FAD-dependent oxidoreductase [Sneathiella marina]